MTTNQTLADLTSQYKDQDNKLSDFVKFKKEVEYTNLIYTNESFPEIEKARAAYIKSIDDQITVISSEVKRLDEAILDLENKRYKSPQKVGLWLTFLNDETVEVSGSWEPVEDSYEQEENLTLYKESWSAPLKCLVEFNTPNSFYLHNKIKEISLPYYSEIKRILSETKSNYSNGVLMVYGEEVSDTKIKLIKELQQIDYA